VRFFNRRLAISRKYETQIITETLLLIHKTVKMERTGRKGTGVNRVRKRSAPRGQDKILAYKATCKTGWKFVTS